MEERKENIVEMKVFYLMIIVLALCNWSCVCATTAAKIHKYMSSEELQQVFHTDADSVPEYEVVKLRMPERLHRRDHSSGSYIHTIAFGENINLWVHPVDSPLAGRYTPVYYATRSSSEPEGVEYSRQYGLMTSVGRIFEDPKAMASLVIGTEYNRRTRINGFIESKRIAIRSLPRRAVDEYIRRRRSIDDPEDPQYSPYHVVIKMNKTFQGNYSQSPVNKTWIRERFARSVEAVPDTLYPEVLVVVENSAFAAFNTPDGHDIYSLLEYLLALWNGVDLKYRSIESPKFRFHIAAIVLGLDAGATPYMEKNMDNSEAKYFDPVGTMSDSRKFWYGVKDTFPLDSYDIVTTMTRHEFAPDGYILGQAYPASACQKNRIEKTIDAIAICTDDGIFSSLHAIAHELGHTFGSSHDLTHEGCVHSYGFLMTSSLKFTTNSSDLSPCSLKEVQKRLDDQELTCLYNRPREDGKRLPKLMPGKLKNLQAQCESMTGGASCQDEYPEHSVCVNMLCLNEEGECMQTRTSALDGTQCGTEQDFCLHQRCVRL